MYKDYFGLSDEPFRMTPDTRFLFSSHRHEEAVSSLMYGIGEKKGFIVITGEIGTGKTTLCRALLNHLDPKTKTAVILNPSLSKAELLHAILDDLSIDVTDKNPTQKKLLDRLNAFLMEQAHAGGNVAVIIDEAQNLEPDVLESIRMLSNLETEQEKLLQIILVGQPELNEILKLPKLEQLRQRIAVRYHIMPLEESEIPKYISHRLFVAGNQKCVQFTAEAIDAIADYTRGTPRLINVICDKCLLAAYACRTNIIDGALAATAIADHEGPAFVNHRIPQPRRQKSNWIPRTKMRFHPAMAASLMIFAVLIIALIVRPAPQSAAPAPATPARAVPQPRTQAIASEIASEKSGVLAEFLKFWGLTSTASSVEEAGMTAIPIVADFATFTRIDLPALVRFGSDDAALVEVTPTSYKILTADPEKGTALVSISRLSPEASRIFEARIVLPMNFAYPEHPMEDVRLPALLAAALEQAPPSPARLSRAPNEDNRAAIIRFQVAAGLPVDGIVGPLTWCTLVSWAHPDFPHLSRRMR